MHGGQLEGGAGVRGNHVQDAATADRGQLVPVPQVDDAGVGLVGDVQQRLRGPLVQHAGLIDDQDVARPELGAAVRPGVDGAGERADLARL